MSLNATSSISPQDQDLYNHYLDVIRGIGQSEGKLVTDIANKTISQENWTGTIFLLGRVKRWYYGSFNPQLIEDALKWLSDKRKEARSRPHLHALAEEITNEFRRVGITQNLDYKALLACKTADKLDCIYIGSGLSSLEAPGLKNAMKNYMGTLIGLQLVNAVALAAMEMENDPPAAPSMLMGNPLLASINGKALKKTAGPQESKAKPVTASSQVPVANLQDIKKGRESLKTTVVEKQTPQEDPLVKSLKENPILRKYSVVEQREGSSYIVDNTAFRDRMAHIKAANQSQEDLLVVEE